MGSLLVHLRLGKVIYPSRYLRCKTIGLHLSVFVWVSLFVFFFFVFFCQLFVWSYRGLLCMCWSPWHYMGVIRGWPWVYDLVTLKGQGQGHKVKFKVAGKNCWKSLPAPSEAYLSNFDLWPWPIFSRSCTKYAFWGLLYMFWSPRHQRKVIRGWPWCYDLVTLKGQGQGHKVKFKVAAKICWKSLLAPSEAYLSNFDLWPWPIFSRSCTKFAF